MTRLPPSDPLIAIIGATGTGKSQLAVSLAKKYNGEIINGDAMQLYAGMPIITNKITVEEQQGIPHHLLGCIGLEGQTWVVGTFVKKALNIIEEIRSRGKLPILVGGTHYYSQNLLFQDRLADQSEQGEPDKEFVPDTKVRWPILNQPTEVLLQELKTVDPVMADRWHPNDRRKIQRSLEIYLQTGRKASEIYAEQRERERDVGAGNEPDGGSPATPMRFPTLLFWVHADEGILRERLDARVGKMLETGLLEEVKNLESFAASKESTGQLVDETKGIWVSIGYKEFLPYSKALQSENADEKELDKMKAEATERTRISTRQYAKRQIRWIRIKLANALAQAQSKGQLFVLDSSEIPAFGANVEAPAADLTAQFLAGSPLPEPSSFSALAAEMLTPKRDYDLSAAPDKWTKQYCEVCNVTCVTSDQWQMHIKSKSHRKLLSKHKTQGVLGGVHDDNRRDPVS